MILGLFLGVSGCALIVPVLERFLYGMDPIDPVALVGVSLILAAVVAVASYVPARRATKVDPVIALRCD